MKDLSIPWFPVITRYKDAIQKYWVIWHKQLRFWKTGKGYYVLSVYPSRKKYYTQLFYKRIVRK